MCASGQFWTEAELDELWQDVLKVKREEDAPTCQASALITPIPEDVTRYLGGDKTVKYQQLAKLECQVKCEKCGITVKSKWLSKTSAASLGRLDSPFVVIACPTCQTAYLDSLRSHVYAKWSSRMLKIWLDCLRMPPAQLGYYESRHIAKEIFNSNPDFLSLVWEPKKGLGVIKNLIQRHLVILDLSKNCELSFSFRKIEIEKIPVLRHSQLFLDWAMGYVAEVGGRISRTRGQLYMSKLYGEQLREVLVEASFYQLSYSIYRASKEAIAKNELERHPRDNLFKHALMFTLRKLVSREWSVKTGSEYFAEKDCPDSFWDLVRMKEHGMSRPEVLAWPLGLLAEAIAESGAHQVASESAVSSNV